MDKRYLHDSYSPQYISYKTTFFPPQNIILRSQFMSDSDEKKFINKTKI
jgi:hypothetical protein